jgi:hypothetical protein
MMIDALLFFFLIRDYKQAAVPPFPEVLYVARRNYSYSGHKHLIFSKVNKEE